MPLCRIYYYLQFSIFEIYENIWDTFEKINQCNPSVTNKYFHKFETLWVVWPADVPAKRHPQQQQEAGGGGGEGGGGGGPGHVQAEAD